MKDFNYFQPTEIVYGASRVEELGDIALKYGNRCLLVTTPAIPALEEMYKRIKSILSDAGVEVAHFDQVQPNPTTENISAGAALAKKHQADVIVGLGGGSSMDSAKAIAVEATHEGTSWDYLFYRETQPTKKTLPIISITTTSGTGSQVTQVAVITNTAERDKSAIYNPIVYPKVAIVDPALMKTVPKHLTAATGFDAFCHSFESILHPAVSPYVNLLALDAITTIVDTLPELLNDLENPELRGQMALADTYAGLCIANAGVTLPHGIGMAIGGMYPHIMHGEALALNYPAFTRYTYSSAIPQFAEVGRIFNPELEMEADEKAAESACLEIDNFLKEIGMWFGLEDFKVPDGELDALAEQSLVLPDYKNNPRVVNLTEVRELLGECYTRK